MSSTYVIGNPWVRLGQRRSADSVSGPDDWFASMTTRHGRRAGHQFGGWQMFGGQPPFGPPWAPGAGGRSPKARRGDVRAAILGVLKDRSMNGYQIIQDIAERSSGCWKPSPGSIYPTLQQLEDEGLVYAHTDSGRRAFALTDDGLAYVAEHPEELASPWEEKGQADDDEAGFKPLVGQVAAAMWQIMAVGTASQQARGRAALVELRRKLHAILAEPDDIGDADVTAEVNDTDVAGARS